MDLRVTLAQTNPALGDLHANLAAHLAVADEAEARGHVEHGITALDRR